MCELAYFIMQEMLSCNRSLTTVAVISCSSLVAAAHTHTHTHTHTIISRILDGLLIDDEQ